MLTISKFTYKNTEPKIHLHHPLPNGMMPKLRKINGFGYSKTHNSWYVSYSKKAFSELKQITNVNIVHPKNNEIKQIAKKNTEKSYITIDKQLKRIILIHPPNPSLWNKLRTIKTSFWKSDKKQWVFKGENDIYITIKKYLKKYQYNFEIKYEKSLLEKEENVIVRSYIESLIMKNYSTRTLEMYLPHFKKFVGNFNKYNLQKSIACS